MIIWIASYPKSGNTWIRSLLSTYLYSDDGIFNFNLLKKINQFPSKYYLDFFLKNFKDIKKVSDFWIAAQERINLFNSEATLLKTHSALCKLENNNFTDKKNTKAVIYIVRDPRNLITSVSHHYSMNIEESYKFLINKKQISLADKWGSEEFGIASVLGSWSAHYQSWKNIKFAKILIIKYEDLINDTDSTFKSILNFLSKFMSIKINKKKILNTINSCEFKTLVKMENEKGFDEAIGQKKFFHLGEKNNWKDLLDPKIEEKIKASFFDEMKELGYL